MTKNEEKASEVKSEVEEVMESTASKESISEERQDVDEQLRQQRVADCTLLVQKSLKEYNCDLDISIILRAGQVIPRIAIVPVEIIQAQRNQPSQPM